MSVLTLVAISVIGHGQSESFAVWALKDDQATLSISFFVHDLVGAEPWIDANHDGQVTATELQTKRLETLLLSGVELAARGDVCPPHESRLEAAGDPPVEVQLHVRFACDHELLEVTIRHSHLPGLAPPHLTDATIAHSGKTVAHVFSPRAALYAVKLSGRRPVWSMVGVLLAVAAGLALFVRVSAGIFTGRRGGRGGVGPEPDT